MYFRFVSDFKRLNLANGRFLLISNMLPPLEQKPFFAFEPTDSKDAFICFMVGSRLFKTPFKIGCSVSVIARLRTLLHHLDREPKEIDISLFMVRNGIPLSEISFDDKDVVLTNVDVWEAMKYNRITKAPTANLFKDLRDTLYI